MSEIAWGLRLGQKVPDFQLTTYDPVTAFRGELLQEPAIRLPRSDKPLLWGLTYQLLVQFLQILSLPEEAEGSHSES